MQLYPAATSSVSVHVVVIVFQGNMAALPWCCNPRNRVCQAPSKSSVTACNLFCRRSGQSQAMHLHIPAECYDAVCSLQICSLWGVWDIRVVVWRICMQGETALAVAALKNRPTQVFPSALGTGISGCTVGNTMRGYHSASLGGGKLVVAIKEQYFLQASTTCLQPSRLSGKSWYQLSTTHTLAVTRC